jgi:DNA invertase Pin-like site-specific DNA recombinase
MQQLLSEVEAGLWEGVLVMEVERLARGNSIDQGIVSQAFKLSNTLIVTPSKIYNPANEFDEEYFEFGLFMSRREYKTINRRLSAGRLASCREGKYAGGVAPYGYSKEKLKGQKGWKLVPIPEEAEVVKLIYRLYLSNEDKTGLQGIANRLTDTAVPTRTGKPWTASQIKNILTNDVYIGKIHWQKNPEVKKSQDGAIITTRHTAEVYHIFDGLHTAIIDNEAYDRVQQILLSKKKSPVNSVLPMQNPFAGVLVCSVCGKPLKRRPIDKRRPGHSASYDCITRGCPTVGCPVDIVEAKVLLGIERCLNEYRFNLRHSAPSAPVYNDTQISACKKKLDTLQKQLTNTFTLLEQGIYDKETFLNRQSAIKAELTEVNNKLGKLENEDNITRLRAEYSSTLIPKLENLLEVWDTLPDAKAKNDLIKSIFLSIKYTKTTKGNRWSMAKVDDFEIEFVTKISQY